MNHEILGILAPFLIIFTPVLGFTIRFAIKPVTDSVLKVVQARQQTQEMMMMERRMHLMEQELQLMRAEMGATVEQKEFYRRLAESAATSLPAPAAAERVAAPAGARATV